MTAARQPVAAPPPRPGAPECRFCAVPLTPHQAVRGICAAPGCETRLVQEAARQVFQRSWQDYVERQRLGIEAAATQVASAVRQLGESPEGIAFGVVPFQDRPVTELPKDRRAAFAGHLDAIVAEAFAAGEPPQPDLNRRTVAEEDESPLAGATCATCQGKCCFLGGANMAFLNAETIQLYRWRHPGATPGEIRAHYLSKLPDRSAEHSCVYHGARGCTLPRQVRADICNRYHCNPQTDLLRRFRAMGATSAVIVGNDDDAGPAVGVFDSAGWRRHAAADVDDVPPDLVGRTVAAAIAQSPPDMPGDTPPARPAVPACAWCGAPIDRHKAVMRHSCGKPGCERRRLSEIAEGFERGKQQRHAALVRRMRERHEAELGRVAGALGVAPQAVAVGVVPAAAEVPLEALPATRRAAFEAHLDEIIAEGFAAEVAADADDPGDRAGTAGPEPSLVVGGCTACAGACCRGGGERAYLSVRDVLRLRRDAALSRGQVRAFYLGRLPAASVQGACVYQGALGCVLPRSARADICNSFRCRGLSALLDDAGEAGARAALIVAVDDQDRPRRVRAFGEDGAEFAVSGAPPQPDRETV